MKILISSESYWPNKDGGAVFERNLVHGLIDAGHEVRVLAPGKSWRHYEETDGESYIYRTASVRLPLNKDYKVTYYARHETLRALNDFQPDVVHVHTMALTGLSLIRHARSRGISAVATNHLMPENVLMSFPKFIMNSERVQRFFWKTIVRFHNRFDAVSTPTESATQPLRDHGLKSPLESISNGVDSEDFKPLGEHDKYEGVLDRFKLPKSYFMYLGRVNAEKRIDMTIDAFAIVAKENPKLHLVIAGSGNRVKELEALSEEKGIKDRVHFLGLVSEDEKRALYQNAEFFIITSPAELQSIVLLEAMASGLPVIAVDVMALCELCHDGENGYLLELDDIRGCAAAIEKLHKDIDLRQKYGKRSREIILKDHAMNVTIEKYIKFYEIALSKNKHKKNVS